MICSHVNQIKKNPLMSEQVAFFILQLKSKRKGHNPANIVLWPGGKIKVWFLTVHFGWCLAI